MVGSPGVAIHGGRVEARRGAAGVLQVHDRGTRRGVRGGGAEGLPLRGFTCARGIEKRRAMPGRCG